MSFVRYGCLTDCLRRSPGLGKKKKMENKGFDLDRPLRIKQ